MSQNSVISDHAFDFKLVFESYGVRVKLEASSKELLEKASNAAESALLGRLEVIENVNAEHSFGFSLDDDGETLFLHENGERITSDTSVKRFFRFFDSLLRIKVAELTRDRVFIHAGVVGWKGRAIVIPANSFRGKTSLVAELVRNGAEYYSDEYAVLDENGLVHSFPRLLAIRYFDGELREKLVNPSSLGGRVGRVEIPIGLVLLTEYEADAVWNPQTLTAGQGIIEMIPHTIPRRSNTEFSLKVLNTSVSDAIILKSPRGEASDFAVEILSYFDNYTSLARIT
ncbi:MAG: hypothetical protein H0U23_10555 [Blastocatellia bacterium]|nr:hypothetical protein [Blastocatellia bacterium]